MRHPFSALALALSLLGAAPLAAQTADEPYRQPQTPAHPETLCVLIGLTREIDIEAHI